MMKRYTEFQVTEDGNVEGVAMPYGAVGRYGGMSYRFEPRSLNLDDPVLNLQHDRRAPVSRGDLIQWQHDDTSLRFSATLPDTEYGRRARELVQARILKGVSIEAYPTRSRRENGIEVVSAAKMIGFALVDKPAFDEAIITKFGHEWDPGMGVLTFQRRHGLSGTVLKGSPQIVSLSRKQKLELVSGGVFRFNDEVPGGSVVLLDGDYSRPLATTANGSLIVSQDDAAIYFRTNPRRISNTLIMQEFNAKLAANLVNGLTPGLVIADSDEVTDADGFTVTRVKEATICEGYARVRGFNEGHAGELSSTRRRRGRI